MPLVTLPDVNLHLAGKTALDNADLELLHVDADRTVKGFLSGKYTSAQMALWATPDDTPGLIRAIVGRLIASKWYATRLSEEGEDSDFAQNLYNEAMEFMRGLISGTMSLEEIPDEDVSQIAGFPDDTVAPFFTMATEL